MTINKFLLLSVTVVAVFGCASLKLSSDLNEKLPPLDEARKVSMPVTVVLSRTFQWLPNGPIEAAEFSSSAFELEINAVKELGIFANPNFAASRIPESKMPAVQISLTGTWVTENCYFGGCLVVPSVRRLSYRLNFSAFDSNGILKYQDESAISGEEKRAGLDFSLGTNPVGIVRQKGIPILIKRGLIKFQASDAFKKLFAVPKNGD